MRIVHLVNELVVANGIVNVTVDLACTQAASGHQVVVASSGGHYESLLSEHGVRVVHASLGRRVSPLLSAGRTIGELLSQFRPDVVHAHTMSGAVVGAAFRARHRFRLVTTVHNDYQRSAVLMGLGDRVVAVSDTVALSMRRRHIPAGRIRVVPNGTIDSPRLGIPGPVVELDRPAVVAIGMVSHRKGSDVLIRAFDTASGAIGGSLTFVGNRDWPAAEVLAASLPAGPRIQFPGATHDVRGYLAGADVFVLASRRDPMPLALFDARQVGLPIVASDVDGVRQALDNGTAGLLVPPDDSAALADALRELLTDPSARSRWAAAATANRERWTVERVASDYERVYTES